mmetsp:Transcript_52554/g.128923  ORF Transcript_52554/g.128923 Transcript_52554/m.128923 type:complete len:91 (+) Transcript_52554:2-274(+)
MELPSRATVRKIWRVIEAEGGVSCARKKDVKEKFPSEGPDSVSYKDLNAVYGLANAGFFKVYPLEDNATQKRVYSDEKENTYTPKRVREN